MFHASLGVGCDRIDPVYRIRPAPSAKKDDCPGDPGGKSGRRAADPLCGHDPGQGKADFNRRGSKPGAVGRKMEFRTGKKRREAFRIYAGWSSSYLDWVMPALLRHPCSEEFRKEEEVLAPAASSVQNYPGSFSIHIQTRQREQQHRREQFFARKNRRRTGGPGSGQNLRSGYLPVSGEGNERFLSLSGE